MKFIFLIILFSFKCSWAWKIEAIRGVVTVKTGGVSSVVSTGRELSPGETLITGPSSRMLLVENNSRIWVGSHTTFSVHSLPASQLKQVELKLGKLRVQIDKPEAKVYNFKVPTAVVGVRGTEFFLGVFGQQENICVLEGAVDTTTHEQNLYVQSNYGAQIMYGGSPDIVINDPEVVKRWVAETSLDNQFVDSYFHLLQNSKTHKNFKYSSKFSYNYCQTTGRVDKDCHRARLLSEWVYQDKLTIVPLVNSIHAKDTSALDTNPLYENQQFTQITLKELSYKYQREDYIVRAGIFPKNWNDGMFLSSSEYTNEPISMVGGELTYRQQNAASVEALVSQGIKGGQPLQGFSLWSAAGIRWIWPKINIFHVGLSQEDLHLSYTGVYFSEYVKQLSFSGQFVKQGGESDSSFTSLRAGYDFNFEIPFKISAATQKFAEDFITSPLSENYLIGASQLLSENNNNQVDRISFAVNAAENHNFSLEYLSNKQLKTGQLLGYETDAIYSFNSDLSWNFKTIFWSLKQPDLKKTQGIHFWFNYGF